MLVSIFPISKCVDAFHAVKSSRWLPRASGALVWDLQKPRPSDISRRLHEFLKWLCCFRIAPQSFPLYNPAGISSYQIVLPACLSRGWRKSSNGLGTKRVLDVRDVNWRWCSCKTGANSFLRLLVLEKHSMGGAAGMQSPFPEFWYSVYPSKDCAFGSTFEIKV